MSRLHDLKVGIASTIKTKISTSATDAAAKVLGLEARAFNKMITKEDPVKVRAFLTDLAGDMELPESARLAFKTLLDGMDAGKPLEQVMQEETKKQIGDLEDNLMVTYAKK